MAESDEAECDYPDDFEEEEEEEPASVLSTPVDGRNEMVLEFKICEAEGLSIVLMSEKEISNKQSAEQKEEDGICHQPYIAHPVWKSCSRSSTSTQWYLVLEPAKRSRV